MKKTLTLGNQQLVLVSSGATPIFYRNEFGRDFFGDFKQFLTFASNAANAETDADKLQLLMDPEVMELIQRMTYIYAKNANVNISPMDKWFEEFEEFPIFDILGEVVDLAMSSISTKKG